MSELQLAVSMQVDVDYKICCLSLILELYAPVVCALLLCCVIVLKSHYY